MDFGFTNDQEELRRSVREVLAAKAGPSVYREALERSEDGTDADVWKTVTDLGWTGVAIEERFGGLGFGLIELAIVAEEFGRAIAPVPFWSTVGFAAQIAAECDDSPAKEAFLTAVAAGEIRATAALGEKDGRFDIEGVAVTATRSGSGYALSGIARNVPEAHIGDSFVVLARVGGGIGVFVVPASSLTTAPVPKASLDAGRRLADVSFDGVTTDQVLAEDGWNAVERGLDRAALLLAAEGAGCGARALEIAVDYAKERKQFDRPIGSFQAISHKCADMLLWVESARSHVFYAAWALEEGTPDAHLAAATAKAAASDGARIAVTGSIQVHGGIGFTWEHDMHLFFRRAKFCELFLGDASQWRERIAGVLASA